MKLEEYFIHNPKEFIEKFDVDAKTEYADDIKTILDNINHNIKE
jgi:hypothetical protein